MVKLLLIALFFCVASAQAITPDELRALSSSQNHEKEQKDNRVNTGEVGKLIPANKKTNQPSSTKYSAGNLTENSNTPKAQASPNKKNSINATATAQDAANTEKTVVPTINSDIYIPPTRQTTSNQIVSDAIPTSLVFGVRLGTWIKANLNRDTSSAEPGTVEVAVTEDVVGDKRTLPAGTMLFAVKVLNNATKRMEMTVTNGITPKGQEFKVRGLIFDPLKVSGLSGLYQIDEQNIAKHGAQKGAVAAVGAATQTLGRLNPLAAAGGAVTQSVLSDTSGAVEYNRPTAVIYVSPQPLLIRVEERF
jgi:hypothetical protein